MNAHHEMQSCAVLPGDLNGQLLELFSMLTPPTVMLGDVTGKTQTCPTFSTAPEPSFR